MVLPKSINYSANWPECLAYPYQKYLRLSNKLPEIWWATAAALFLPFWHAYRDSTQNSGSEHGFLEIRGQSTFSNNSAAGMFTRRIRLGRDAEGGNRAPKASLLTGEQCLV
jgi:hypothetical protein